jgi:hypothetical protein
MAGAAFALTFYTYGAAWLIVPLTMATFAVLYRRELFASPGAAKAAGALFALLMVPFLLHITVGKGLSRLNHSSIPGLDLSFTDTLTTAVTNYFSYFSLNFLVRFGDDGEIVRHFLPGAGHLFWFQPLLVLAGVALLASRRGRTGVLLLLLLLTFPLTGALSDSSPISSRTILGPVVMALIAGYGAVELVRIAQGRIARQGRWLARAIAPAALAVLAVVSGLSLAGYMDRYHGDYPALAAGFLGWQYGPREIVAAFEDAAGDYDQFIMDWEFNSPTIFFDFYAPEGCAACLKGGLGLYDPDKRQLFALKPEHLDPGFDYVVKQTVAYPSGETAFVLVEATRANVP